MQTIHILSDKKLIKSMIFKSISTCMYLWLNSGFWKPYLSKLTGISSAIAKMSIQNVLVNSPRQIKAYANLHVWPFINSLKTYILLHSYENFYL